MRQTRSSFLPALAFTLGALLGAPALAQDCPPPTPAELEAIATAYFDAFNTGDRAALDALLAADYVQNMGAIMSQDRALHLERLAAVRIRLPRRRLHHRLDDDRRRQGRHPQHLPRHPPG